ncbi:hypothetical protein [Chitinimonas lacunae]|uniref:Beta-ketoacyl synthase N-terminal domain-containing protein n=1 Tax=Chitinimonas lacunae TaxID=1963018 RepID=A0ABV8MP23_9NEIS
MTPAITIVAAACGFPSGPTMELADTAVRSQLSLLQAHPHYLDRAGIPAKVSCFPAEQPFAAARWETLALAALDNLTCRLERQLGSDRPWPPSLLWLVLPDPNHRPALPAGLFERLSSAVRRSPLPWETIEPVLGGHAAGMTALGQAAAALAQRPDALAVILAVEADLSADALTWLDLQALLHGAHEPWRGRFRPQPYGRIPAEGAAALALARLNDPVAGWATLLGCATAAEPMTYRCPEPCTGLGLTQAVRQALSQAGSINPIDCVLADLNGEPYRADQYGFTALRLSDVLQADWQTLTPALASGDLGSASAIAHLALAAYSLWQRPQAGTQLVLASSDDPLRGAALLGATQPIPALPEVQPWRSPSTSTA